MHKKKSEIILSEILLKKNCVKGESHATDGVGSAARLPMNQLTAWWRIIAAEGEGRSWHVKARRQRNH